MEKSKNKRKVQRIVSMISGVSLTVIGFLVIPKVINKYSQKIYKRNLKADEIDFENMGPKIVTNRKKDGE
jgi:hypothetical protein